MKNFAVSVLYLSFAALVIAVAARLFFLPGSNETPPISEEELRQELYDSIYEEIHDAAYAEGLVRGKIDGYNVGRDDGYEQGVRDATIKTDFDEVRRKHGFPTHGTVKPAMAYLSATDNKYHLASCSHLENTRNEIELNAAKSLGYEICKDCFY